MGTITKALDLLEHFSSERPQIRLSEFHRLVARDKATVYRHLTELVDTGFLEQDNQTKNYRIGPAVLRLAHLRESVSPLRTTIQPLIDQLSDDLGELVHVNILQGKTLSPLCYSDTHRKGLRVSFSNTELLPLHATASGYSVMTYGPDSLLAEVCKSTLTKFTTHTLTSTSALKAACRKTLTQGYSESDSILEHGIKSFAFPLYGDDQFAVGAMSAAVPTSRASVASKKRILTALATTAPVVSRHLGGTVPKELTKLWQARLLT